METLLFFFSFIMVLIMISFLVACLEMTFQLYMQPNMILYPYSVFLSWFTEKGEVFRHLARPLGRCRFCNGTWIMIYTFIYLTKFNILPKVSFIPTIILIGLSVGLTAFFINVLMQTAFKGVDPVTMTDKERGMNRYEKYIMESNQVVLTFTPWQAMMKSYGVLAVFYGSIYIFIPYLLVL